MWPCSTSGLHLPEEEGEQQGADVGPVDVGVGEDHDLVVADLGEVELVVAHAGADGGDQRLDLGVLQHAVEAGPLDVEDLAPDGEDGLDPGVAGVLGRAAGGLALDDEQLATPRRCRDEQSASLPGRPAPSRADLRRVSSRAWRAARRARDAWIALATTWRASAGCSSSHSAELVVGGPLDQRAHEDVAELGLGLALELGVAQLHADDGGEALPDVLALEVVVLLLEQVLAARA